MQITQGIIIKGLGGLYTVACDGRLFSCPARGIFRKEGIKPMIGDKVTLDVVMLADDGKVLVGDDLKKAKVEAEVLYSDKSDKVIVYKYKAKNTKTANPSAWTPSSSPPSIPKKFWINPATKLPKNPKKKSKNLSLNSQSKCKRNLS